MDGYNAKKGVRYLQMTSRQKMTDEMRDIYRWHRGQRGFFRLFTAEQKAQWIRSRTHVPAPHQGIIAQLGNRPTTLLA